MDEHKDIEYVDDVLKILVTALIVAEENRGKSVNELDEWYSVYDKLFKEEDDDESA